jgi:hypothetical protein
MIYTEVTVENIDTLWQLKEEGHGNIYEHHRYIVDGKELNDPYDIVHPYWSLEQLKLFILWGWNSAIYVDGPKTTNRIQLED